MKRIFVLTIIGPDHPGIVQRLSHILSDNGANWLQSRMANLAGEFAGILHAEVDRQHYDKMLEQLHELATEGLQVTVKDAQEAPPVPTTTHQLEVVGSDREGIVRDISEVLARHQVNVEELTTEFTEAPMSSTPLFKATALLSINEQINTDVIQSDLEEIAHDLMIEIDGVLNPD